MNISIINSEKAPRPIGPYAQAVAAGDFLYTSGQIAIDPVSGEFIGGSIEAQTTLVLNNLAAVLSAKEAAFQDVVATTIYLTDLAHFKQVNTLYAQAMGDHTPARTTVEVSRLPLDAKIEIAMTAYLGRG
ncbi:MAG: reactive intermediate/imine deaminase [Spirochaetales bacterium]|nr:reactive intermediate/imine deaminase [Spirochaetales bacterium]